jgi:hypothetical protein
MLCAGTPSRFGAAAGNGPLDGSRSTPGPWAAAFEALARLYRNGDCLEYVDDLNMLSCIRTGNPGGRRVMLRPMPASQMFPRRRGGVLPTWDLIVCQAETEPLLVIASASRP